MSNEQAATVFNAAVAYAEDRLTHGEAVMYVSGQLQCSYQSADKALNNALRLVQNETI